MASGARCSATPCAIVDEVAAAAATAGADVAPGVVALEGSPRGTAVGNLILVSVACIWAVVVMVTAPGVVVVAWVVATVAAEAAAAAASRAIRRRFSGPGLGFFRLGLDGARGLSLDAPMFAGAMRLVTA